ncbi:MAG: hypothetical protein JXA67_02015 [Micromonosporaceae bacterium]|nr:hypothetical protein [Micromonosporaceae bacterium]
MSQRGSRSTYKIRARLTIRSQRLSPHDELAVALHTIDDFARSIQGADAKAGVLAAVLCLVVGGAASDLGGRGLPLLGAVHLAGIPAAVYFVFVASLIVAGIGLSLTQLPRLNATVERNVRACRLAFPEVARHGCRQTVPTAAQLRDEAWDQAEVLAVIALRKFQHLRIALFATGVCVAAFLSWMIMSGAPG